MVDLVADVREECEKFGRIASIEIPRPRSYEETPGLGKVTLMLALVLHLWEPFSAVDIIVMHWR
jgi:hypothetical protein